MEPFDYNKTVYLVTLKSGATVRYWPNADTWHALDGSGRVFSWEEVVDAKPVE
jgi:hypothetical protein